MTEHVLPVETSRPPALRALLLVLLYSLPIFVTIRPVTDPDIWWHLREGQWIVEHQTVPVTDPFSSYGTGKRWIAYSWLFEVLVYGLYRSFGLLGLVLYTAGLAVLITRALHGLMQRLQPDPRYRVYLDRERDPRNGPGTGPPEAVAADHPLLHRRALSDQRVSVNCSGVATAASAADVRPVGEHQYSIRVRTLRAGRRRHRASD